jgi:hypothetical protein
MDALVLKFDITDGKVHYKMFINARDREKKKDGDEIKK